PDSVVRRGGARETPTSPDVAAQAPRATDWLSQIPALDSGDGLCRVLGRPDVYVDLLRRFVLGQARTFADIRAALAENRRADAERAAHTLKGVAGTIGAREVQREAGEVESVLRQNGTLVEVEALLG